MFTRRFMRHQPRLTTTTRLRRASPRPRFASTGTQSIDLSTRTVVGTVVGVGIVSCIFGYWIRGRTRQTAASEKPATLSDKHVPDLNKLGLSNQIAYSPTPTSEDVTRQLNEHAFSLYGAPGVTRYDGAQLASNNPCEDAFVHGSFSNPFNGINGKDWMAWAVFDGHCGWQTSNLLTKQLMPYVRRALGDVEHQDGDNEPDEAVEKAIISAFKSLDDVLVNAALPIIESTLSFAAKARRLETAYAGSCALLTLFDPSTRKLRVASTGDCRAVLGQKTAEGKWESTDLTTDHTGANPSEVARLQAQFPDEPDIVNHGRVWGMQPSRTFGDGMWKWTAALKQNLRYHYGGPSLPSAQRYKAYRDGPYLTAEPAVSTTTIPDAQPSFLILATDGLWDTMSSAQAVDLVGRWVDWRADPKAKPVMPQGRFEPTVLGWKQQCRYEERKATVRDANAAVHLVRNGLGGGDEEMVKGALTFRSPNSRDIRDDITVQVVFFAQKNAGEEGRGARQR
ncbi:protein serine/threonine phosphatase 2C [Whalleya microplaca]|nr:protein serine/threonine phosphatase 2C [Whalleya microplaca]